MSSDSEAEWPRLLRHAAHELRTPLGVGLGYLGFILSSSDGPLTARQRQFVAESQKALGRIRTIADEMSELARLEAGEVTLRTEPVDIGKVLAEAVAALPPVEDRRVTVNVATSGQPGVFEGDSTRLRTAFTSILFGLRRELVTSPTLFVRETQRLLDGRPASWIAIGDADQIDRLAAAGPDTLKSFEEWRGGCGLNLAIARRILEAHGGQVWSPGDGVKAGAAIALPPVRRGGPQRPPDGGRLGKESSQPAAT
ncbi:MAG: two-component system, sensor histidine kinase and response regulator [Acidobacteriota bacterium]|jgi:signal transduction histidine kinase